MMNQTINGQLIYTIYTPEDTLLIEQRMSNDSINSTI